MHACELRLLWCIGAILAGCPLSWLRSTGCTYPSSLWDRYYVTDRTTWSQCGAGKMDVPCVTQSRPMSDQQKLIAYTLDPRPSIADWLITCWQNSRGRRTQLTVSSARVKEFAAGQSTHTDFLLLGGGVQRSGLRPSVLGHDRSQTKKNRSWSWSCRSDVVLWNTVLLRSSS